MIPDGIVFMAAAFILGYLVRELFQYSKEVGDKSELHEWYEINTVLSQQAFRAQRAWTQAGEPQDGPLNENVGHAVLAYNEHMKRFPL
jgi:hypothetical protein